MKETDDVQNILARLEREISLNVPNPSIKLKKQYHKVEQSIAKAIHELDILNDMKESIHK